MKDLIQTYYSAAISAKFTHLISPTNTVGVHYGLDTLVDELLETLDTITETYLADSNDKDLSISGAKNIEEKEMITFFETLYYYGETKRDKLEPFQQSLLDDLQTSVKHVIYRLKRTK